MKKALIFGVSGQDGAYLARLLLDKGYQVTGTSRDAQMTSFRNLAALGVRDQVALFSVTLTDFRSVLTVLTKVVPDEIYHLAGQSSVGLSFEQPVETFHSISLGTLNLLEAVRFLDAPVRLYNASSSDCFGDTGGEPATEETPFAPRSPYAVAKAAAHFEVANYREAYKLFACNGILFNHESPLRPPRFVTRKIVSAACRIAQGSGERLRLGNIDVARDWGYAPQYVEAMWRMLQRDTPEDYVIATGQTITLRDFTAHAFDAVGLDWRDHVDVDPSLFRPSDIAVSRANPSKAAQRLGWRATLSPADVARAMVAHEMGQPQPEKTVP
ncbi:NAD-dependent epimerase/dehydratase [Solidesulfovibrio fructosivorans JJ]]|uniref:GDP-mannose 4,6-dehydratase n=1 Tax=Solidesulfovibrio fructosivorans JJ] TaxID=596151 RepID=E1JW24_SOLFR|nr:GDP-mannose 4,6-dehydratase [Solidesulfovibrio fructosivorans]EFL51384.1 NAD-dependent epimerase/dehydratase [Solidesulfovibrio fructosivorans JJ]]